MSIFTQFDADYSDGYYSGIPHDDGSIDVLHDGSIIEHHTPEALTFKDGDMVLETYNQATGEHQTMVNGHIVETRSDNIFGGEDIYHGHNLDERTIANVHGGEDVYSGDMQLQGITMPNVFGGEDYLSMAGNSDAILGYQDPLIHANEFHCNPFDING